ncbi:MAG TPA: phospholipase D-like domain-containing protein [Terriglobia bacterium]|nr:phospholipase D-like domain-containing protein [Terriglobia bacterium]
MLCDRFDMEPRNTNPTLQTKRTFTDRALSRVAGASLIEGNQVRLLRDAAENYPAWLEAIGRAKRYVHLETFIFHDDETGREFANLLAAKVRDGVRVRIIYDWLGGLASASWRFWAGLRNAGVDVRCFNPPRFDSPLGWLVRDHRKMVAVDGSVGFIAGLCIGKMWVGDSKKGLAPWRDTGVELRGPAVAEIERAFAQVWRQLGEALPDDELFPVDKEMAGTTDVRIVATMPSTAGMIRTDQFIAALARERLWISDAYYAATPSYMQALRSAARDGVDVRLLVPNSTDLPLFRPLSRAGYRSLLEAGVRVFEWNGTMMHAKTAVADGFWARVGSTNLNLASWFGNCELDAIIEDEDFAHQMEEMYLDDLNNSTEIVLDSSRKVRVSEGTRRRRRGPKSGGGRTRRAVAGAVRLGNVVGAAFTSHRVLGPVEARLMVAGGLLMLGLALAFGLFPGVLVYPIIVLSLWMAAALLYRGYRLHRRKKRIGED